VFGPDLDLRLLPAPAPDTLVPARRMVRQGIFDQRVRRRGIVPRVACRLGGRPAEPRRPRGLWISGGLVKKKKKKKKNGYKKKKIKKKLVRSLISRYAVDFPPHTH
jgi:hypothetical protein